MDERLLVEGFVLAGGQSSRMGRDKALVELSGRPLVDWAVGMLRAAGLTARIAGARTAELARYAPVVADESPDMGPLGGVCSALKHTAADWAVFVPIDLPLIPSALISLLMEQARTTGRAATIASLNGFAQTFPAVVRRDALPVLEGELRAGRSGAFAAFNRAGVRLLPVEMMVQAGWFRDERGYPAYRWFWNVNTPEELQRVEAVLKAQ